MRKRVTSGNETALLDNGPIIIEELWGEKMLQFQYSYCNLFVKSWNQLIELKLKVYTSFTSLLLRCKSIMVMYRDEGTETGAVQIFMEQTVHRDRWWKSRLEKYISNTSWLILYFYIFFIST